MVRLVWVVEVGVGGGRRLGPHSNEGGAKAQGRVRVSSFGRTEVLGLGLGSDLEAQQGWRAGVRVRP